MYKTIAYKLLAITIYIMVVLSIRVNDWIAEKIKMKIVTWIILFRRILVEILHIKV